MTEHQTLQARIPQPFRGIMGEYHDWLNELNKPESSKDLLERYGLKDDQYRHLFLNKYLEGWEKDPSKKSLPLFHPAYPFLSSMEGFLGEVLDHQPASYFNEAELQLFKHQSSHLTYGIVTLMSLLKLMGQDQVGWGKSMPVRSSGGVPGSEKSAQITLHSRSIEANARYLPRHGSLTVRVIQSRKASDAGELTQFESLIRLITDEETFPIERGIDKGKIGSRNSLRARFDSILISGKKEDRLTNLFFGAEYPPTTKMAVGSPEDIRKLRWIVLGTLNLEDLGTKNN